MQAQKTNLSKTAGFSLAELMVVIAVMSILMVILFPVFAMARDRAHRSVCTANLHQVALTLKMYACDYDGVYPINTVNSPNHQKRSVWSLLTAYTHDPQIFHCPDEPVTSGAAAGYTYRTATWNNPITLAHKSLHPESGAVVAFCAQHIERSKETGSNRDIAGHMTGSLIIAREDGSVSRIMTDDVEAWTYHRGRWYAGTVACPPASVCIEHYPGEVWPPQL